MPFSDANFVSNFNAKGQPQYVIDSVQIGSEPRGGSVRWSSFWTGGSYSAILTPYFEVNSGQLQPYTWDCSIGSFSFGIKRDGWVPTQVTRGQVLILRVGYVGMDVADFERVAIGRLWSATLRGAEVVVNCRDLLALGSRFDVATSQLGLFGRAGSTTTVAATFTAGVSTTLTVADNASLEHSQTLGGAILGAVSCKPAGSDAFYLKYTAAHTTTPDVINGVSIADVWGTTQAKLVSPEVVTEVAVIEDHPAAIARRILSSTGTPSGDRPYDDLPAEWGFGLPEQYIDSDDIDLQIGRTQPASGNAVWTVLESAERTNPGDWLRSFLAPGGWFLAMRQGSITVRAVPDMNSIQLRITDYDIIRMVSHDYWHPDFGVEYRRISATAIGTATNSGATETATTNPVEAVSDHIIPAYTNESAQLTEVVGRLKLFELRIPERMELLLQGALGAFCVGDEILLSTRIDTDRQGRAFTDRASVITSLDVDWLRGVTTVVLMIPSDQAAEI